MSAASPKPNLCKDSLWTLFQTLNFQIIYIYIYIYLLDKLANKSWNESVRRNQQNPRIHIRNTQEDEGSQKSSFNIFRAVTCVRVDGWAFPSSEKRTNEWKVFKYSCKEGKVWLYGDVTLILPSAISPSFSVSLSLSLSFILLVMQLLILKSQECCQTFLMDQWFIPIPK